MKHLPSQAMVVCVPVPVPRRRKYIHTQQEAQLVRGRSVILSCHDGPLVSAVKSLQVQQLFQSVTFDSLTAVCQGFAILNVTFIHTCTAVSGMLTTGANGSHSKRMQFVVITSVWKIKNKNIINIHIYLYMAFILVFLYSCLIILNLLQHSNYKEKSSKRMGQVARNSDFVACAQKGPDRLAHQCSRDVCHLVLYNVTDLVEVCKPCRT